MQNQILHSSCLGAYLANQFYITGSLKLIVWSFLSSDLEFDSEQKTEQSPAGPAGAGQHIFTTGGPATVVGHHNEGHCFTAALSWPLGLLQSCHSWKENFCCQKHKCCLATDWKLCKRAVLLKRPYLKYTLPGNQAAQFQCHSKAKSLASREGWGWGLGRPKFCTSRWVLDPGPLALHTMQDPIAYWNYNYKSLSFSFNNADTKEGLVLSLDSPLENKKGEGLDSRPTNWSQSVKRIII